MMMPTFQIRTPGRAVFKPGLWLQSFNFPTTRRVPAYSGCSSTPKCISKLPRADSLMGADRAMKTVLQQLLNTTNLQF